MKQPWMVFHDEIAREIRRRKFDNIGDFRKVLIDVGENAVIPHLTRNLGWSFDRAEDLYLAFLEVVADSERDDWGPKLKATWDEWNRRQTTH